MPQSVDLYGAAYGNFDNEAQEQVRRETYGEDFGQSSWVTADEYRCFWRRLELGPTDHVLDVGCGSGGPAVFLAGEVGCQVSGVDIHEAGIRAGQTLVRQAGLHEQVRLRHADVREPLPFADETFDAIVCMDVICHLADRRRLFEEWHRVLRSGGRVLYTDPVVVTGLVTKDDLASRSSTGHFEFCPPGVNERLVREAKFDLLWTADITANVVTVSKRWQDSRQRCASKLIELEGDERFAALQGFLDTVHRLSADRRLSRFVYLAGRRASNAF